MYKFRLGITGILIITLLPIASSAGELSNANTFVVKTQDMEPYLNINDTIMASNSTSFNSLKVGDIIVFRAPEARGEDGKPKVIVHRISEIGTFLGKKVVTTKGDANPYSVPGIDFPIFMENYIGKVVSVNAQNETRTFEDCVTDTMGVLTLFLIFAPTEDLDASDIVDPAYKKTVINMCNFYHEKSGIWVDLMDEDDRRFSEQYGSEFYQKYGNTIPESLKQFAREQAK